MYFFFLNANVPPDDKVRTKCMRACFTEENSNLNVAHDDPFHSFYRYRADSRSLRFNMLYVYVFDVYVRR